MSDIFIRNVDPAAVKTIDEKAKKKGMSRNEYLKLFMKNFALHRDVVDLDSRYRELVDILAQRLEQCNDVIKENSIMLEKILDWENVKKKSVKLASRRICERKMNRQIRREHRKIRQRRKHQMNGET